MPDELRSSDRRQTRETQKVNSNLKSWRSLCQLSVVDLQLITLCLTVTKTKNTSNLDLRLAVSYSIIHLLTQNRAPPITGLLITFSYSNAVAKDIFVAP